MKTPLYFLVIFKKLLQINIGILSPGAGFEVFVVFVLVLEDIEGAVNHLAGIGRHYDVVDVAAFGAPVGVLVKRFVFAFQPGSCFLWVFRFSYLPGEDDAGCRLGADYINPCRRPGEDEVGAYSLIEHTVMGSGIRFPEYDGYQGYRGIRPGEKQLGSVAEDTLPVLFGAYHVAAAVAEGYDRDVKEVAEPDEPGAFIGGIDID